MKAEPLPSSSTTPSATRSSPRRARGPSRSRRDLLAPSRARGRRGARGARARGASSSVAPSSSASASASASVSVPVGGLGLGLGSALSAARERRARFGGAASSASSSPAVGSSPDWRAMIASTSSGLAQAAEAVDAELVGDQVEVGERALLERVAVQYGRHVVLLGSVMVGWRSGRVVRSDRQPDAPCRSSRRGSDQAVSPSRGASTRSPRSTARTARKSAAARTSWTRTRVRAGVRRPADRRQRRGAALARRPAGDRAEEVLARDGQQQRAAELVQRRRAAAAPRPSARASWRSPARDRAAAARAASRPPSATAIRSARKSRTSATTSS